MSATPVSTPPSSVRIWWEGHPIGGNERKGGNRYVVAKADKQDKADAFLLAKDAVRLVPGTPYGQCVVTVTWCWPARNRHDWDNAVGMLKGIFDGLTGVVWQDDASTCIVELRLREKVPHRRGIIIEIEPIMPSLFP